MTIDLPALWRSLWKPWLAVLVFALLAGWSTWRDSPQGMLIFSGDTPCPQVRHSFTYLMVLILIIAAVVAMIVAITARIASELGVFAGARSRLRKLAGTSVAMAVLLLLSILLKWPLESVFTLRATPPCPALKTVPG